MGALGDALEGLADELGGGAAEDAEGATSVAPDEENNGTEPEDKSEEENKGAGTSTATGTGNLSNAATAAGALSLAALFTDTNLWKGLGLTLAGAVLILFGLWQLTGPGVNQVIATGKTAAKVIG